MILVDTGKINDDPYTIPLLLFLSYSDDGGSKFL
jgi:hypothetical protein